MCGRPLVIIGLFACFILKSTLVESSNILWMNDIYLDGRIASNDSYFGDYRQATSLSLWASAIRSIRTLTPSIDYILLTGNMIINRSENISDVFDSMQTIVTALRSLNTIRSFPIFGETDVNEQLDKTAIYSRAGTLWQSWIGDVSSLIEYGYYMTQLNDGIVLIALNTNHFLVDRDDFNEFLAERQIFWLASLLDIVESSKRTAIIAGHTPPGIDQYGNTRWQSHVHRRFLQIIDDYRKSIRIILFAGSDSFRLFTDGSINVPLNADNASSMTLMFTGLSLAPYRCNRSAMPAFAVIHTHINSIVDIDQYFMNLTQSNRLHNAIWIRQYSYASRYGYATIDQRSMIAVFNQLIGNDRRPIKQWIDMQGYASNDTIQHQKQYEIQLICRMISSNRTQMDQCINRIQSSSSSIIISIISVSLIAISLLLILYSFRKTLQRLCNYKRF